MTVQHGFHVRFGAMDVYKIGKLFPHDGKFFYNIVPFFYIINLFMQSPFYNDLIWDDFII